MTPLATAAPAPQPATPRGAGPLGVARTLLAGAASTAAATAAARALAPTAAMRRLDRTNFHGRTVSLRGGLVTAVGAATAASCAGALLHDPGDRSTSRLAVAALVAATSGTGAGLVDDLDAGAHDGDTPAKGLRGHLGALAHGRVTTGALKIAVIGSGGLVAGVLLARARRTQPTRGLAPTALDAVTSAVAVASWANVMNLLDLRPGRALKATVLAAAPLALAPPRADGAEAGSRLLAAAALGTAAAALPEDLAEVTMQGDTGANALGALLGTALAAHPATLVRAGAAVAGTALVLASEKVSFSAVIASHPLLARLDAAGRTH